MRAPGPSTAEPRPPARSILPLLLAVGGLLALTPALPAQDVRFTPRPERPAERRLAAFLERGAYRLWTADTVLAREDTLRGDLLVLESVVRIAGRVEGSVYVVDGDLFLRPGAAVTGDLVVLGGGFYRSELATVDGETLYRPNLFFQAVPADGGWEVYATREVPRSFQLDGPGGFHVPAVQRTDGWILGWGARLRLLELPWQPSLHATASYRTARETGGFLVEQGWHPSGRVRFGVELEKGTGTMDRWIRNDLSNSLAFFFAGRDYRNYWARERLGGVVEVQPDEAWRLGLRVEGEDARSLPGRKGRVLLGDEEIRPNPPVDEGRLWSTSLVAGLDRRLENGRLRIHARVEASDADAAGDFTFVFGEVGGRWQTHLVGNHWLEARALLRGDLSGDLPRQRWSALGGPGTLPTLDLLARRGPRLAFGELRYRIPVEGLRIPHLGAPEILSGVAVGSTWSEGLPARFDTNLLAGLHFLFLDAWLAVDPSSDRQKTAFLLGVRLSGPMAGAR